MKPLIVIVGPTAAGKSEVAVEVALRCRGEIVSADSVQIYHYLKIGSARLTTGEMRGVPHHLLDLIDLDQEFSVADFQRLARGKIAEITSRGHLPFLVGGTGLYIQAVIDPYQFPAMKGQRELRRKYRALWEQGKGYLLFEELRQVDPVSAAKLHPNDFKRVARALEVYHLTGRPISSYPKKEYAGSIYQPLLIFGITRERQELYQRIDQRAETMFRSGLIEEVRSVLARGYSPDVKPLQTLGYKQVIRYLTGECDLATAIEQTKIETRHFAKRQLTWFKRDPRVQWLTVNKGIGEVSHKIIQSICRSLPFFVE